MHLDTTAWIGATAVQVTKSACKSTPSINQVFTIKNPGMFNVRNGVLVDVLSRADLVICGVNRSGREVGPPSLYPCLHPAKIWTIS